MSQRTLGDGLHNAQGRAQVPVGTVHRLPNGNKLEYIKLATSESVLPVKGSPLAWRAAAPYDAVTTDLSRSRSSLVAGVCYASGLSTSTPYGWMLTEGTPSKDSVTLKTDGNVAADTVLIFVADKVFDGINFNSSQRARAIGYALAADSGSQLVSAKITGYLAG